MAVARGLSKPKLQDAVQKARDRAASAIDDLPVAPAAIPALVRGVNVTAEFNLGFTEPFCRLHVKLRALA